jgi:hypothetical protein
MSKENINKYIFLRYNEMNHENIHKNILYGHKGNFI